ncbi:HPP family protein [Alicyclobacillus sp. ALC3]|uniref:HPP family protein n=1 Tax=Alicyclobacillus sp. ALC3 TaxID=2796143 RepID=UPI0027A37B3C|nr:HPP family protein [Alicyclobacillus sp. ALC3]
MMGRLRQIRMIYVKYEWGNWMYHGRTSWPQAIWFLSILLMLALLDGTTKFTWLVPPFAATLTILLLLPKSPIAQPIPVIVGTTLAASFGTAVSMIAHGPIYAVLAALAMVILLPLLRIYHPPGVALSMYPLLLHTNIWFPFLVVLPVTLIAVSSCSVLSRLSKNWANYPLPLRKG